MALHLPSGRSRRGPQQQRPKAPAFRPGHMWQTDRHQPVIPWSSQPAAQREGPPSAQPVPNTTLSMADWPDVVCLRRTGHQGLRFVRRFSFFEHNWCYIFLRTCAVKYLPRKEITSPAMIEIAQAEGRWGHHLSTSSAVSWGTMWM